MSAEKCEKTVAFSIYLVTTLENNGHNSCIYVF